MAVENASHLILNVDDNEVGRYTKSRILRHAGFEVIEAETGQRAIDLTRKLQPELVLLDVKLPDINGFEVCRHLKAEFPDIFVLQISASRVTEGDRVRGLEGGADAYLTQPVSSGELIASINALLRIRKAEHALRASEAHLQGVLASATDYAIIRLDEQGAITGWNSGAVAIFGWSTEEALARDISFIFTEADRKAKAPSAEQALAKSSGRADDKRWHIRKDGSLFYAVGVMTLLSQPAAPGFLKILRDQTAQYEVEKALHDLNVNLERRVTERTRELEAANIQLKQEIAERARAEDQLRQRDKMDAIGQLTGGIAHDFNNVLAVVMAGLGLIERQLARGDTDVSKYIQSVMESAKRAADLTQSLLAFSRQQPLAPDSLVINQLVSKMTDILRRTLGENINIQTVLAAGLWRTWIDASQLENAILNLAVNARDAMEEGGKLTIETANTSIDDDYATTHDIPLGEYVMLAVTDTGVGMTRDVREKAFEPFFTTKKVGKGTGLGLSQVFGFVRQSGGYVRIYSELGMGTAVKVYLPRYLGEQKRETAQVQAGSRPGNANEVVLLVEDEERVRLMALDALRSLGYSVIPAENGLDALRIIEAGKKPDLLLTDVVMPEMNGRELADRAVNLIPNLKVLFTTGYMRNAVVHGNVLDNGRYILQKPFSLDQLASKVRLVLDNE
ncbi:MAG: response regulator [Proteobacteria bacterium]|nr:response regulator [Pseudomonadota bacterium]